MGTSYAVVQPASAAERQFWLAEQIAPGAPAQQVLAQIHLHGPVWPDALGRALAAVHHRHEALRTAFVLEGRQVVRKVLAAPPTPEPLELPADISYEMAATALLHKDCFDLAMGRVHRTGVSYLPEGADVYIAVHHIAFDGLSMEVFAADLARAYALALDGGIPDLGVRHRAEPSAPEPARLEQLTRYWRDALDGVPDLPTGGPQASQREIARAPAAEHREWCPAPVWEAVRDRARRSACSPYAVLLTAYGRLLAEVTGAVDFCVGTPVALRSAANEDELGCLINTVPVRLRELDRPDAVDRVWAAAIDSLTHADLPTDAIVRECRATRGRRMPLFQTLFAFQSWQRTEHPAGPARLWTVPVRPVGCLGELQLQVAETSDGRLEATVQAPADGPWAARLHDLTTHYFRLLNDAAALPGGTL